MDKEASAPVAAQEKDLIHIPGAEPSARIDAGWALLAIVIVVTVAMVVFINDPYRRILRFVTDGIVVTVYVTILSFIFTLVLGMVGGLGRLSKNRFINTAATTYVELIRGIPLMVQLMWWYFAFPSIIQGIGRSYGISALQGYQANPNLMAVIGLTFCYGAYMSEIYRAGIQSIPPGQMEAARSVGMNYFQAMRYIILPQAIRVILPPVGNEFIALLKDSSLVSVVAVTDLTRRSREYFSTHFNPLETMSFAALLYLIMTLLSARVVSRIESSTRHER